MGRHYWIGFPHHLWTLENAEIILNAVGEAFVDVDGECLELIRLDVLRVKIRVADYIRVFEPIIVNGGGKLS